MLSVQNLRVEFGARVLFSDLTFAVQPRERVAFAGHNGAGKSTLMKCIAGTLEPSGGRITKPRDFRIGYLPQEGIHMNGRSLWDETLTAFGETLAMQREIDRLSAQLPKLDPRSAPYAAALEEIGALELKLEAANPALLKPRAESVLQGLGFSRDDFARDCGEFSGGWQMRIAMAKLFLAEPEALLLDEPTNHLDIESQRWVESYLHAYPGAILIISHDIALLDGLCTRTIAFHHGRAEEYSGNYSFYLRESAARREALRKRYETQQREIDDIKRFISRFRYSANKASLVQSRVKMLEKMELVPAPEAEDAVMDFHFPQPAPSHHLVARLEGAGQSYGDLSVFRNFDFEITRGEKIAVVGPNGAGKSTFCRLITGTEAPAAGTFELGGRVIPSFFSQTHADALDEDKTVLETIREASSREMEGQERTLLGCFLFHGDDVFKKVGVLSGGERSRVALVRMLVQPANFLILDEPTNHLDVQSQQVLQNALREYEGTVIIVSHNRSFLDPLVTKTLEFRPGHSPRLFSGNISYYLEKTVAEQVPTHTPSLSGKGSISAPSTATGINRKDQRREEAQLRQKRAQLLKPLETELEKLEAAIAEMEAEQAKLTKCLSTPEISGEPERLREAVNALAQASAKLESSYTRWDQLSEEVEKMRHKLAAR